MKQLFAVALVAVMVAAPACAQNAMHTVGAVGDFTGGGGASHGGPVAVHGGPALRDGAAAARGGPVAPSNA